MSAINFRSLLCAALLSLSTMLSAEQLTLARLYAEPALGGKPPMAMRLSPDGSKVTFLRGKAENSFVLDLWAFDVKTKKTALLVDSATLTQGAEVLSEEEKARRERMRMAALSGIIDYQFSADGQKLLFPLSGNLYLYELTSKKVLTLTEAEDGAISDPKFSPKGNFVSFVRGQNLFAIELKTKKEIALSSDGGGTVAYGMAEFVAQEEMARFTGYWWAPDETRVAMQRYDEAPVALAKRFEIYADRTEVIEQRYPAAGTANALVELWIVPVAKPADKVQVDLGSERDIYLARVDWLPDSSKLALQRQSRDQKTLELQFAERTSGKTQMILSERSPHFVNLNYGLRFLKKRPEFLWLSERSGFNHLYRYDLAGNLLGTLSAGDWQIDSVLAVDESAGLVYVSGNKDDPIQTHTYALSLDGKTPPKALTTRAGTHASTFSNDAKAFLDSYSDLLTPPQVRLHRADGAEIAVLDGNAVEAGHPLFPYQDSLVQPEYGQISAEGQSLQYRLFKPKGFDPTRRYPALVYTYGGPHVQVLARKWGDLLPHVFAAQGYVVFSLDNRGSARRGVAFEAAIHRKMGGPDVQDQLNGIRWLGKQSFIDAKRIGVYGWSYGGYMSLHILAQGGDLLAAGAAGAPVTDWAFYDTHYTERYMDTPKNNPDGYKNAQVSTHLDSLKARLLLIHGMADDNVLFTNSTQLMSDLQARGIGFDLMTYPGMKHGPSNPKTRLHIYSGISEFFKRELKPESGAQ